MYGDMYSYSQWGGLSGKLWGLFSDRKWVVCVDLLMMARGDSVVLLMIVQGDVCSSESHGASAGEFFLTFR